MFSGLVIIYEPEFANFISQALDVHNMTKEKRKIPDNPHRLILSVLTLHPPNIGMTNMKMSIRFCWETGHHFAHICSFHERMHYCRYRNYTFVSTMGYQKVPRANIYTIVLIN
jgi:hypothetical protein